MPSTPATRAARAAEVAARPGCRELRRARSSGARIGIYVAAEAHLRRDPRRDRWSLLCEDHGTVANAPALTTARYWLARPEVWCEDCAAEADRRRPPPRRIRPRRRRATAAAE